MRLLDCFTNTVKLSWKMMMKLHLWQKKVASWSSVKPNSADLSNQVLHVLFSPQCGLVINPREPGDWIKSGHVTWCAKFDFLRSKAGPLPSLARLEQLCLSCFAVRVCAIQLSRLHSWCSSDFFVASKSQWLLASEVKRLNGAHVENFSLLMSPMTKGIRTFRNAFTLSLIRISQ